ncbi:MAG: hypothetical protein ACK58M_09115 [Acidobacteriota bacterium]|jgi:hypothetical protein|nr:hypothetical protein [Bryobacteraceae bacterium CoA2 C42]
MCWFHPPPRPRPDSAAVNIVILPPGDNPHTTQPKPIHPDILQILRHQQLPP